MTAAKPSFRIAIYALLAMAIAIFFLQRAGLLSEWRHALEGRGLSRSGVNTLFGIGAGLAAGLTIRLMSLLANRKSPDEPEAPASVAARMKSRLPSSPKNSPDGQDP